LTAHQSNRGFPMSREPPIRFLLPTASGSRRVAELPLHVDRAFALLEQQRGEGVAEAMRGEVCRESSSLKGPSKGLPYAALVQRRSGFGTEEPVWKHWPSALQGLRLPCDRPADTARATRISRSPKFTSSHFSANASPNRTPVLAMSRKGACIAGTVRAAAARNRDSCSRVIALISSCRAAGPTMRRSGRPSRLAGFARMAPSSTAALSIARSVAEMIRGVPAASRRRAAAARSRARRARGQDHRVRRRSPRQSADHVELASARVRGVSRAAIRAC